MTTPEEATCLAVEELRERVEGKLSRIIRVWSNDLSTVLDALLAAEARIRVLEEALEALAEALTWCTENDGECLGDHPKRLSVYVELLAAYKFSAALAKPEEPTSP